jgi:DNA-binding winged helix-turn-helix (wHTH) protein
MSGKIRFGVYELDRDAMELRKHGVLIRLQDQPFRVLAILAGRPGEIVTREELQEQIWGSVFVDFDQSLNKAVNRIREALNDDAGTPQYVETVPRRGYRFIAAVAAIPQTENPIASGSRGPVEGPAQFRFHGSRPQIVGIAALATAIVLATVGIITVTWLRQPAKPTLPEARHITSSGWAPALSRDGKLLAYVSTIGGGAPRIWVQQTAGGEAIAVTSGSSPETGLISRPMARALPSIRKEKEAESTPPQRYRASRDCSSGPPGRIIRGSRPPEIASSTGKTRWRSWYP